MKLIDIEKGWKQGFVYAVAQCVRLYQENAAEQLWIESGFDECDLKHCEKYDADEVRKLIKKL